MLRYFENNGKYNFVDSNNVVLGYCSFAQCCEVFGWKLVTEPNCNAPVHDLDEQLRAGKPLVDWTFDRFFNKLESDPEIEDYNYVYFRIVNDQKEAYIMLYNLHNGYYSHNFIFTEEKIITEGYI